MLKPMVEVRVEGGVLVAEFWDCLRLDPAPVRDLRSHFESHIRAKGKPDLIIDMNGVVFAGSASLGGFVALHRLARQHGGRIVFCKVDENVHEVFRISKLSPMFLFVDDRDAAIASLSKPVEHAQEPAKDAATAVPDSTAPVSVTPTLPRPDGPLRRARRPQV